MPRWHTCGLCEDACMLDVDLPEDEAVPQSPGPLPHVRRR